MNDQLNSEIKAVFDDIVARTPPLGELDGSNIVELSSLESRRDPRRWTLPVAAALMLATVGVIVLLSTRRDGATPPPVATEPVPPTQTVESAAPQTSTMSFPTPETIPATTEGPVASTPATPPSVPASTLIGSVPAGSVTVLAFSDDGTATQIAPGATTATPLFTTGPLNDRWDMFDVSTAQGVAYIGTCCEPATGSIYQVKLADGQVSDNILSGYGVAISPDERFVATGEFVDNPVVIRDVTSSEPIPAVPSPGWTDISVGSFTPNDILWLDNSRLLVLGSQLVDGGDSPALVIYDVSIDANGTITSVSDMIDIGMVSDYNRPVRFAGRPTDATVALHQQGASEVTVFDLQFQSGSTEPVGDQGYDTVWYSPGYHLATVDTNGQLRIDDVVIPGTYAGARAT